MNYDHYIPFSHYWYNFIQDVAIKEKVAIAVANREGTKGNGAEISTAALDQKRLTHGDHA